MLLLQHIRFLVIRVDAYFQLEGILRQFSCIRSISEFKIKLEEIKNCILREHDYVKFS